MSAVLVTGASGFVGSAIAHCCQEAGFEVRCTGRSARAPERLRTYTPADLLDSGTLSGLFTDVDMVVHAAGLAHQFGTSGQDLDRFTGANVRATENVVGEAITQGVRHVVLISSVSVYGPHGKDICTENHPCRPHEPYALSKYEAERRAIVLAQSSGLALTILRLATVYGEGDPGNIGRLMRWIDRGRFVWIGSGGNCKSLIHRDDVAQACTAVLHSPAAGINVYNVASDPSSVRDIVEGLARALNRSLPRWHVPAGPLVWSLAAVSVCGRRLRALATTVHKWLADDVYDATKFRTAFAFRTQVGLADGLRRQVDWYRRHGQ